MFIIRGMDLNDQKDLSGYKTYEVVCSQCNKKNWPYRKTPPDNNYVCAVCLQRILEHGKPPRRKRGGKVEENPAPTGPRVVKAKKDGEPT